MSSASTSKPRPDVGLDVRAWHGGWALAQMTLAGLALVIGGAAAASSAGVLALIAAPGAVGALRAPKPAVGRPVGAADRWALGLLALWSVASAAAVLVAGGASTPFGIYALAPAVAAAALGAPWTIGLGLAACAGVFVAVAQLAPRVTGGDPLTTALVAGGALVIMAVAATSALAARFAGAQAQAAIVISSRAASQELDDAVATVAAPVTPAWEARFHAADVARAEAEAEAASRARFLANMSHELRTPLNAIMGFSDIMRTRLFGPMPERYAEYAELIHESGRHLVDLINDVLDLSKIDAERYELRREVFDAREPVTGAIRLMRGQAEEAGVTLRVVVPAQPVEIDADPRAIKQIVLNLVSNAIKFTPRGGEAAVILGRTGDAEVEIAVTDTGVGVAPEDLARLGRPFEQADAGRRVRGSGLGLSLVRGFARLHGGEMGVESRLGEGTAVSVRLPVAATASPVPALAEETVPTP